VFTCQHKHTLKKKNLKDFLEDFHVHSKIEQKVKRVPIPFFSLPQTRTCNSGTFVANDEPTLTLHYHPKSTVYIRAYSWYYIFYRYGQIYNDTISTIKLSYRITAFIELQFLCAHLIHSSK
jgi:hypothetical protein